MSIPKRNASPMEVIAASRTFFVSSSTWGKRSLLQSERCANLFIETLYEYRAQGRFRLHAFVVMPDHFHVLITVGPELAVERAVQLIKGGFAFRARKQFGLRPPIWQKSFSEVRVRDHEAYAIRLAYIQANPIRRHLATDVALFPFSSANPQFVLDPAPQGLKPLASNRIFRHG